MASDSSLMSSFCVNDPVDRTGISSLNISISAGNQTDEIEIKSFHDHKY